MAAMGQVGSDGRCRRLAGSPQSCRSTGLRKPGRTSPVPAIGAHWRTPATSTSPLPLANSHLVNPGARVTEIFLSFNREDQVAGSVAPAKIDIFAFVA
jgi:hypothetical protein